MKSILTCSAKNSSFYVFTEKKDDLKTGAGKERASSVAEPLGCWGFLCFVRFPLLVCCSSVLLLACKSSCCSHVWFVQESWKVGLELREKFRAAVAV